MPEAEKELGLHGASKLMPGNIAYTYARNASSSVRRVPCAFSKWEQVLCVGLGAGAGDLKGDCRIVYVRRFLMRVVGVSKQYGQYLMQRKGC